ELEAWQADIRYRGEHERALAEAQGAAARLCLERAQHGFGRAAHGEGMLWLARALVQAPPGPPGLARGIRAGLAGWQGGGAVAGGGGGGGAPPAPGRRWERSGVRPGRGAARDGV